MTTAGKHTSHLIFVRTAEYNSEKGMIPFKRRYIFTLTYPINYTFIQIIYGSFLRLNNLVLMSTTMKLIAI
jgi:hypothetical protein